MTADATKWFLRRVKVPLSTPGEPLDVHRIQLAASSVVSQRPRSFEVFWDGTKFELCFGSGNTEDLDHTVRNYVQHVKVGDASPDPSDFVEVTIGSAGARSSREGGLGGGGRFPAPSWLPKVDPAKTKCFHVSNAYGHAYCMYDVKRTGLLMTPLLLALRRSQRAWVQFLWFECPLQGHLSELGAKMRETYRVIDAPILKTRRWVDDEGRAHYDKVQEDHPAKYGEYHSNYRKMDAHLMGKSGSRLIVMIIRGQVQSKGGAVEEELPFSGIEDSADVRQPHDLSFSKVQTQVGESKIGEWLKERWTDDPRLIYDLVERRVFDVGKEMKDYVGSYLKHREGLPFVIMTSDEMGLLVHMPSSDVLGVDTTRQSDLPTSQKRGVAREGPLLWELQ
jgi:hypothetical protein